MAWIPSCYYIKGATCCCWNRKPRHRKRGQTSPDDGDALALTFAQAVAPAEEEERDQDDEFGGHGGINARARGCVEPHSSGGLRLVTAPISRRDANTFMEA